MARLPTPGADNGVWGSILNDFLSVEHNSDGSLKASGSLAGKVDTTRQVATGSGLTGGGDLSANRTLSVNFGTVAGTAAQGNDSRIVNALQPSAFVSKGDMLAATGSAAVTRVGVGNDGQTLVADAASAAGITWATPNSPAIYPLAGYGPVAATDAPAMFSVLGSVGTGNVWLTRMWVPPYTAFSKIAMAIGTGGTYSSSATPNRLAWYDDSGVLQDQTADDSTMWSTTNSWYVGNLTSAVPAQNTGRFIYVGNIIGGYSSVSHIYAAGANRDVLGKTVGSTRRRAMYTNGQTAMPNSFDPSAYGTLTGYIALYGLL